MRFMQTEDIVIIRGGGDIATGVIQKFYRSGIKLLVLETEQPTAIRRSVALCQAVYAGRFEVEDVRCERIESISEVDACFERGAVPILIDPSGASIKELKPAAVIDAILAKRNMGTNMEMAPVTIALGPGFIAGKDVNAVIETMRGHNLGRLIFEGAAEPNTGTPGEIGGKSEQRVIHAPIAGEVKHIRQIGDVVNAGSAICCVAGETVTAPFTGLLRGLIHDGIQVHKGMKIADIDPRLDVDWKTISDKARCIGGAVLEAYFCLSKQGEGSAKSNLPPRRKT